jgi:signal transduction histidine kinase/DNA-binding response OmpR family regulator
MSEESKKIKKLEEENTRLKSSVAELKVLNDIAVSSCRAADIDQMLNLILRKSISAVEAEQGSILLTTKIKNKPLATFVRQDDTSRLKHNYHIGTNITGWVLMNKEPLIIENLSEDRRFKPTEEEKKDIHSVLGIPIWFEGEITGLMMLINKKNEKCFSMNDLTLLSIISVQAGQLIKNLELQREKYQERREAEKLQEIDKLKTNFFTNVSHEFKTPLTLILGLTKNILESSDREKVKQDAEIVLKNAKKINLLANQLLELSKIEAGQVKLKVAFQDVVTNIKDTISAFQPFAESKNISFELNSPAEEIFLYYDRDKIDKIFGNLISNAIKFTPQNGKVDITVSTKRLPLNSITKHPVNKGSRELKDEFLEIAVSDSGIGISKENLNRIFDRFFRVGSVIPGGYEGTGIGLSFAKELIELHKGKLSVESKEGEGSTFRITLSMNKGHYASNEIVKKGSVESIKGQEISEEIIEGEDISTKNNREVENSIKLLSKSDKPVILIIEDNPDVRKYIAGTLENEYRMIEAEDGREGLNSAFQEIPDLIISDIMMPYIDGIKLCKELKKDMRTSHIPLILLTARSAVSDKVEGFKTGADDYIIKPFDESELKARIGNLLRQRKRLHEHFRTLGFFIEEETITPADQKFIQLTTSLINQHIADTGYSVEMLASDLAVSRSLLHKKLMALIGESPSDLIRRMRLNKALKLIEQKSGNISEIALEVGFNNPSYFANCFQKQFGFSPSRYHQNYIKQN